MTGRGEAFDDKSFVILGDLGGARNARRWLSDQLRNGGYPPEFVAEFLLAAGEALNNVIKHGYKNDAGRPIGIRLWTDPTQARIQISDSAGPFQPRSIDPPRPEDLAEGGYGLHLVHALIEGVRYENTPSGNVLHLTKKVGGRSRRAAS